MKQKPVVFVTQIPLRHIGGRLIAEKDISSASSFGTLRVIFPHGKTVMETKMLVKCMMEVLCEYDYDRGDYLLMLGDPTVIAVAAACLTEFTDRFRILKWERSPGKYFPVEIQIPKEM